VIVLPCRRDRRRRQRGAAAAEYVLVMMVLLPMINGIIEVGLTILVRNTLAACASDAARYGAAFGRSGGDALASAQQCVQASAGARWANAPTAGVRAGMMVVHISASVPPLGLVGPGYVVHVSGHAVQEHG
jgi:Flp pilus assembly protein TadG